MGAFGPLDTLDLPPPTRATDERAAAEQEEVPSGQRASRWWFSFDGWHSGGLDEEFVLA